MRLLLEKKELTTKEKLLFAASTVGSIAVLVLASMQALGTWDFAYNLYMPVAGLVLLCQTELNKERSPQVSKICMISAVIIFAVLALNIIL